MAANGSGLRRVDEIDADVGRMNWSPDGARRACALPPTSACECTCGRRTARAAGAPARRA
jgi:hypothetical protein